MAYAPLILATGNPHKVDELRAIFTSALDTRVLCLTDFPHIAFHEPAEIGSTFEQNATIKALAYAAQLAAHGVADALVLADDSGIEIDALKDPHVLPPNPRPGVISSHYSTDGVETGLTRAARDAANNIRVLRELEGLPFEHRTARFVCVMVLATLTPPPRGRGLGGGFESTPIIALTNQTERAYVAPEGFESSPSTRSSVSSTILHLTRGTFDGRIGLPPRIPAGSNGFGYDPLFLVAPTFIQTGAELASEEKNRLSHRAAAARSMAEWIRSHRPFS